MSSFAFEKILVIATHCIGDSLLLSAYTRSLRNAYPQAQLDVLVNERGRMVFEGNADISNLVIIPSRPKLRDYLRLFKVHGRYDLVVNEMLNDRTAIYSALFGKVRLGAVDLKSSTAWMKQRIYQYYIIERNNYEHKMSRCARMLGLINVDVIPHLVSPEATLPKHVQCKLSEDYIVVHTPSSNEIKQWPVEHWHEMLNYLLDDGYQLVLTGADISRDRQIASAVIDGIRDRTGWISCVGELSLAQTSTVIKNSRGFIGPDSGPGHLASGYLVPLISLISVAPASLWSPWPYNHPVNTETNLYQNRIPVQVVGNVAVLQSTRDCVPCYGNKCRISHDHYSPCLVDISPKQVINTVRKMMPLR
ncbi:glycosyltransferase family 9 protein [Thaumasiovibrio sp. DFM-14]|uniref:glycosyltransferase family 9 protein n=1 Tax=Thaumasiovibrio sp. DFM-14 TaxID=3384792 RepID=UPI0039A347F6